MLWNVLYNPEYLTAPRGQQIHEITNMVFSIDYPVAEPIVTADPDRNKQLRAYYAKEIQLYESMTNLASDFGKASKFWLNLANPDGTVNSAYGHLIWQVPSLGHPAFEETVNGVSTMRTPWEWAVQSLKADSHTRQAVIPFAMPQHYWRGNKDQVCTLHGIFHIRNNALNFTVTMRSQDCWLGLSYDLPFFVHLMDKMLEELKPAYPNLTKGRYTHMVHSFHLYTKNVSQAILALGTHSKSTPPCATLVNAGR
jgi:thymidylate synthase